MMTVKAPIYEIIGVAGSGKTTLLNRLSHDPEIALHATVRSLAGANAPWAKFTAKALLMYLRCLFSRSFRAQRSVYARMFDRLFRYEFYEVKSMVKLAAYTWAYNQRVFSSMTPRVMDQGPVFGLALLEVLGFRYGPAVVRRELDRQREGLKHNLAGIVILHAPSSVLKARRHRRGDWNIYKDAYGSPKNLDLLHQEYEKAYVRIADEFEGTMRVLRINTMDHPEEEVEGMVRAFMHPPKMKYNVER